MDPEDILYGAHWILLWPVSRLADFSLMRAHLLRLLPDQGLGATVRLARHLLVFLRQSSGVLTGSLFKSWQALDTSSDLSSLSLLPLALLRQRPGLGQSTQTHLGALNLRP